MTTDCTHSYLFRITLSASRFLHDAGLPLLRTPAYRLCLDDTSFHVHDILSLCLTCLLQPCCTLRPPVHPGRRALTCGHLEQPRIHGYGASESIIDEPDYDDGSPGLGRFVARARQLQDPELSLRRNISPLLTSARECIPRLFLWRFLAFLLFF
jgi:hypothetical protein